MRSKKTTPPLLLALLAPAAWSAPSAALAAPNLDGTLAGALTAACKGLRHARAQLAKEAASEEAEGRRKVSAAFERRLKTFKRVFPLVKNQMEKMQADLDSVRALPAESWEKVAKSYAEQLAASFKKAGSLDEPGFVVEKGKVWVLATIPQSGAADPADQDRVRAELHADGLLHELAVEPAKFNPRSPKTSYDFIQGTRVGGTLPAQQGVQDPKQLPPAEQQVCDEARSSGGDV